MSFPPFNVLLCHIKEMRNECHPQHMASFIRSWLLHIALPEFREKGEQDLGSTYSLLFTDESLEWQTSSLLTLQWPNMNHLATCSCKRSWGLTLFLEEPVPSRSVDRRERKQLLEGS